jgi:hypothetical protein
MYYVANKYSSGIKTFTMCTINVHLLCTLPKHKEHGINDVALPTAIWANNS